MITLGLNAAFHDSAAALVIDGVPVAAAEEERFTRLRNAQRPLSLPPSCAWQLPFHAIEFCLREAGLVLAQVDHVACSFDPTSFAAHEDVADAGADPCAALLLACAQQAPALLAQAAPAHLPRCRIERSAGAPALPWRWHQVEHTLCHQASAFLAAPFERCAVMTLGSRAERSATRYGVYRDGRYRALGEVALPHSLGRLAERVTAHLGLEPAADEPKATALAALAPPAWADTMARAVRLLPHGDYEIGALDLRALTGPPRTPGAPFEARHLQLAASWQAVLEQSVLALAGWLREASGERSLAFAGALAHNAALNARLRDDGPFEQVWVPPAAGHAGTALGAALWIDGRRHVRPDTEAATDVDAPLPLAPRRWRMTHAYLGPGWTDVQVQQLLIEAGLEYLHLADERELVEHAAALLAAGCVIGWHQGRMEWGPQALGARSILASPIDPDTKARLKRLQDPDDLRGPAAAVPLDAFADWFAPAGAHGVLGSPFMQFTQRVRAAQAALIPGVCHDDGSALMQTVEATQHARFHALLTAFGRLTGVPVLVNAPFHARAQPIVCSPQDALAAYFTTPLDALVIGSFVLRKPVAAAAARAAP